MPAGSLLWLLLLAAACALGPVRKHPARTEVEGVSFRVVSRPESLLALVHVTNDGPDEVRVTAVRYTDSAVSGALSAVEKWGRVLAPGERDSLRLPMDPRVPPNQVSVAVEWERVVRTRVPRKRETGPPSSVVGRPPVTDPVPR
jgi:hypothetical protein